MTPREKIRFTAGSTVMVGIALSFVIDPQEHFFAWSAEAVLVQFTIVYFFATMRKLFLFLTEERSWLSDTQPPKLTRSILWLLAKPTQRDAMVDDLDEIYLKNLGRHGVRWARWLYRLDAFRSFAPQLLNRVSSVRTIQRLLGW